MGPLGVAVLGIGAVVVALHATRPEEAQGAQRDELATLCREEIARGGLALMCPSTQLGIAIDQHAGQQRLEGDGLGRDAEVELRLRHLHCPTCIEHGQRRHRALPVELGRRDGELFTEGRERAALLRQRDEGGDGIGDDDEAIVPDGKAEGEVRQFGRGLDLPLADEGHGVLLRPAVEDEAQARDLLHGVFAQAKPPQLYGACWGDTEVERALYCGARVEAMGSVLGTRAVGAGADEAKRQQS